MTAGDAPERSSDPAPSAGSSPRPPSRSVHESASAPDPLPKIYIEAGSHPVLPETDEALAVAIEEEARRERRKDRARPWLLLGLGGVYLILVAVGMVAAVTDAAVLDNLVRLYALVMPVLTAALGAAAAYYFTNRSGGAP